MPTLEVAYQQYRTHGLTVVAVNVDEGGDRSVQQAVDALRVTYPIWRDPRNRFARHFRVQGLPETFLIGRDGAVRYHWQGQVDPITPANQHRIRLALGLPPTDAGRALQRRGRRLAEQRGCITCHSTDGSWRNGPPWRQLLNQPVVLTDGRITIRDRSYLRRALLEPDADIVSGYAAGLMAGALPGQPLTEDELEALLLYLESL
jgi:mono/diheme cytochrome c family protein